MLKKGIVFMLMMVLALGMVAPAGAVEVVEAEELVQVTVEEWYFHAAEMDGMNLCGSDGICESTGPYVVKLNRPQMHGQTVVYLPESVAVEFCRSNDYVTFGFFSPTRFVFSNYSVNDYNVMVFSDKELYQKLVAEAQVLQKKYGHERVSRLVESYREQGYMVVEPVFGVEVKTPVDVVKCKTASGEIYVPYYMDSSENTRSIKVSDNDISWDREFTHAVVEDGESYLPLSNILVVNGERTANRDLKIEDTVITIFNQF